jgi:hypothetical protein
VPESKNTNDATDEGVDKDVTDTPAEVEGDLVDVPDELKDDVDAESDEDEDEDEDADQDQDVPAAVAAGTKDKKDKATKIADSKKPGKKPGKTVKPPRAKKAEKARKSGSTPRRGPKQRRWVAPLMLACWLIGLAWLVVFYVAGNDIPYMKDLGNWNLLIGMGLIALGFVLSTQWV